MVADTANDGDERSRRGLGDFSMLYIHTAHRVGLIWPKYPYFFKKNACGMWVACSAFFFTVFFFSSVFFRHPIFMSVAFVVLMPEGVVAYRNHLLLDSFGPIMQHGTKHKNRTIHMALLVRVSCRPGGGRFGWRGALTVSDLSQGMFWHVVD